MFLKELGLPEPFYNIKWPWENSGTISPTYSFLNSLVGGMNTRCKFCISVLGSHAHYWCTHNFFILAGRSIFLGYLEMVKTSYFFIFFVFLFFHVTWYLLFCIIKNNNDFRCILSFIIHFSRTFTSLQSNILFNYFSLYHLLCIFVTFYSVVFPIFFFPVRNGNVTLHHLSLPQRYLMWVFLVFQFSWIKSYTQSSGIIPKVFRFFNCLFSWVRAGFPLVLDAVKNKISTGLPAEYLDLRVHMLSFG